MIALRPHQKEAIDWFLALQPRRGTISLPPGSGKTLIGLRIIEEHLANGPALIVVPARVLVDQWAYLARAEGLVANVLDSRTAPQLLAWRNAATDSPPEVWVTTAGMLRNSSLSYAIAQIPWSISVFDEAQRASRTTKGIVPSSTAVLFLTAIPDELPSDGLVLPSFKPRLVEPSRVSERTIDVTPTDAEQAFLAAVRIWEQGPPRNQSATQRGVAARQCFVGVLAGIRALESLLAGAASPSEERPQLELDPPERRTIEALLEIAYSIELPDSRSTSLIEEIRQGHHERLLVVSSAGSYLSYLGDLLANTGIQGRSITAAMDPAERDNAVIEAQAAGAVLLVTDSALGPSSAEGRDVLVHGDLPPDGRITDRLSVLLDRADGGPSHVLSLTVQWRAASP